LNILYKTVLYTIRQVDYIINRFLNKIFLFANNVKTQKNVKIKGKLFLRNYGILILNDDVTINSKYSLNPIGGNSFTSLYVDLNGFLSIGKNTGISNSAIYCKTKIEIGENVLIGGDCKIYDTDFHSIDFDLRNSPNDRGKSRPVKINNGVFIGTGVTILKGTTIGENSVVGAGSVVAGYIPPNEIWAGNPVKYIKSIS
jgi:acetyltransferase-like isoleucine patch superfamily enzyme